MSKWGEGTGGPLQVRKDGIDPNAPTYDPATSWGATENKILWLLADERAYKLVEWERNFLLDVYGKEKFTRAMHIKVGSIFKKHFLQGGVCI